MKFHEKLVRFRKERGWTQEYVANALDVSRSTYVTMESGETDPNLDNEFFIRLGDLTEVEADFWISNEVAYHHLDEYRRDRRT